MKTLPKLCLNMIVKNESHIITDKLDKLLNKVPIDYYVICDTGSSDNTKDLILTFFQSKKIDGELYDHEWRDFGTNRSKSLELAYGKSEYVLVFDADDEIHGDLILPVDLTFDKYNLKIGDSFVYYRPLLLNNSKKWNFIGVLHEFLSTTEPHITETILTGNYHIQSGREGNRSKDTFKYLNDANTLKQAHESIQFTDPKLASRYAFYCAQSYKDAGTNYKSNAIEWYSKVLTLSSSWEQEKYYSCIMLGKLHDDNFKKIDYYMKSIEYDNERIEGMVFACKLASEHGLHSLVNMLYNTYKEYKQTTHNKLFVFSNVYNDHLAFYSSISCYYLNKINEGYKISTSIIEKGIIDSYMLEQTYKNLLFYKKCIKHNDTSLKIFYHLNTFIHNKKQNTEPICIELTTLWEYLFNINKPFFTQPKLCSFENRQNPKLVLTFTTCKRIDLFKQTVQSLLNQIEDIDMVDYWFCVDDNSTTEDRKEMSTMFPWIDYYMKTDSEKGHRTSMNIIYEKLKKLDPVYWFHIEDDFLFFSKINIGDTIRKLELCQNENVKQILLNVNYAETISDYSIQGARNTNIDNVVIHDYKLGRHSYKNCHYWPHYSFRPSIIKFDAIKYIGNFDSENQFFEMDYANKYKDLGYKSIFLNEIKHIHIGKLTSQKNSETKNAYALNQEDQFENKNMHIKVVNLERRRDRKEYMNRTFQKENLENWDFFKAVDGSTIELDANAATMFYGNDFGSRKGVIGCALSHYNLWKELLNDTQHDFYVIFEDDIKTSSHFYKRLSNLKTDMMSREYLLLGYSMFEKYRIQHKKIYENDNENVHVNRLNKQLYIGGTFGYSINKIGARKMIDYIEKNGIKHGIDYLILINSELESYECNPQLVFSEWNENGQQIDTDIQNDNARFDLDKFVIDKSLSNIRKIRIKMICNWATSKELCDEWKHMCDTDYSWENIEITWENENIDFYVIINYPFRNEYFDKKRTVIFQMEPWVQDKNKKWGIKTWGKWAQPNKEDFLAVIGRNSNTYNNVFWQFNMNPYELNNLQYTKADTISSVSSNKYFDEGHIARIDFLKYLDQKNDIPINIFGNIEELKLTNYKGKMTIQDKHNAIVPYKYYFMVENNYEKGFITEKMWEPILCESLVFYYGCPDIHEYVDSDVFVLLDMNDFEKSYQIIKQAIQEDWWSQRIGKIKIFKEKLLNEMAFFPRLRTLLDNHM